jgi:hypothetical protein
MWVSPPNGAMKPVPYPRHTNIMRHRTKFGSHGELVHWIRELRSGVSCRNYGSRQSKTAFSICQTCLVLPCVLTGADVQFSPHINIPVSQKDLFANSTSINRRSINCNLASQQWTPVLTGYQLRVGCLRRQRSDLRLFLTFVQSCRHFYNELAFSCCYVKRLHNSTKLIQSKTKLLDTPAFWSAQRLRYNHVYTPHTGF